MARLAASGAPSDAGERHGRAAAPDRRPAGLLELWPPWSPRHAAGDVGRLRCRRARRRSSACRRPARRCRRGAGGRDRERRRSRRRAASVAAWVGGATAGAHLRRDGARGDGCWADANSARGRPGRRDREEAVGQLARWPSPLHLALRGGDPDELRDVAGVRRRPGRSSAGRVDDHRARVGRSRSATRPVERERLARRRSGSPAATAVAIDASLGATKVAPAPVPAVRSSAVAQPVALGVTERDEAEHEPGAVALPVDPADLPRVGGRRRASHCVCTLGHASRTASAILRRRGDRRGDLR